MVESGTSNAWANAVASGRPILSGIPPPHKARVDPWRFNKSQTGPCPASLALLVDGGHHARAGTGGLPSLTAALPRAVVTKRFNCSYIH